MIFSKFERLMAKRYLRAKRKEGFISVITGFAFTGIALGVATPDYRDVGDERFP